MSSNHKSEGNTMKVELKYCEHCGGLWVRESGAGVYCAKCEPKVADLPIAKKSRRGDASQTREVAGAEVRRRSV